MSQVEFEGEGYTSKPGQPRVLYSRIESSSVPPRIVRFLVDRRIVKTENQATMLLLVLAVILAIASFFIYRHISAPATPISQQAVLKTLFPNETF